jgi:hypothetical protein
MEIIERVLMHDVDDAPRTQADHDAQPYRSATRPGRRLIAGADGRAVLASLPPAASPIETTTTEQKNDDYDDKKRGCVHDF